MDKKLLSAMRRLPIPIPDAAFSFMPFDVFRGPVGGFVVDPNFDLQTYAGVSVTKEYWVKPAAEGGSDLNSGADESNAFATISHAMGQADVDRIRVKAGLYYLADGWNGLTPNRNLEVIGYDGDVISSTEVLGLVWAADGVYTNCYKADVTGYTSYCVADGISPDIYGDSIPLHRQATLAAVDANPGSFLQSGTDLYVRLLDDRAPDSDVHVFNAVNNGRTSDPVTYYVEGVTFHGGGRPFLAGSSSALCKLYMRECAFKYSARNAAREGIFINGLGEVILENCVSARNGGDAFKSDIDTVSANLILINPIGRFCGRTGDANVNGYSRHEAGNTIIINGEMFECLGRVIQDVNLGGGSPKQWNMGLYLHDPANPASGYNFAVGGSGAEMWIDTGRSTGAAIADIEAGAGSTIYYRNFDPATPVTAGAGTVTTY